MFTYAFLIVSWLTHILAILIWKDYIAFTFGAGNSITPLLWLLIIIETIGLTYFLLYRFLQHRMEGDVE
ncbi:hypothetical protein LF817_12790 [Halobacillus sp. A1]|uniref:hypothetical protein n=1 Tax=Halobacillus sp. A1 TaxID=2880262 RepID=UPI0020A68509|nr:hypothetical protein [Halobacillus sp. A1]MCP3032220.1 hypothetical protein [Halobacillus sp. A1]